MDEFNDLDNELAKLKQELSSHGDEWTRQFNFPGSNDYWKRRQEEDSAIWQKRLNVNEEEKKILEEKLKEQKLQIEKYNEHLREVEKKIEEDARRWEERFKVRETELMLEKNRVLWEEKMKEKENENHFLLSKVSELNAKIGEEKEQQLKDRDKTDEYLSKLKEAHEDKTRSYTGQVDVLRARVAELEKDLGERMSELRTKSGAYEEKIKKMDDYTIELARLKDTAVSENCLLKEELSKAKLQNTEEKKQLQESLKLRAQQFVSNFYAYLGPLLGLLHGISTKRLSGDLIGPVKDSVQRLENETGLFMTNLDMKFQYNELYTLGLILPEDELGFFNKLSASQKIRTKVLDIKAIKNDISRIKPQAVLVSIKFLKYAYKIKNKWSFIPVIIFGTVNAKLHKKLLAKGFEVILPPYITEEIITLLNQTVSKSIAWPEYWEKIQPKRDYLSKLAVMSGLILLCLSGYYLNNYYVNKSLNVVLHFNTPYPQPTNITFDGQNIWVCDWFGQSIYKHSVNNDFKLIKIFHFPEKHFTTLAWAGGYLWSADPWNKKIYKHNMDEALSIIGSYQAPNAAPSGLAGDREVLWSCDSALAQIYRHRLDDKLTVEETYKSPGSSPSGLYFDGEKLWSLDSKTNKIYCHDISKGLAVEGEYLPVGYEQKGYNLSGIAISKDRVWVCSERLGEIQGYQKTLLKKIK
ncbi:MAG: hypothetical protein LHV68_08880 [Elusimicrobia bacterium]|nr:hypothetical protein [Candidatus Liberimonas magnetica]